MKKEDCIFCKIAHKEIKTNIVLETDDFVAFNDLNPQAPTHVLIIPKKHYDSLSTLDNSELAGKLLDGAGKIAKQLNISDYRVVINNGEEAGQTVFHVHLHILGGRPMLWPPG